MLRHSKRDFLASIVVFLVALPLCMGVALASGLPASAGLITGIVGGLVVSLMSGSSLQVSGPAAGLSVIVWEIAQEVGLAKLGLIIIIAGGFQALAGLFKLGQWFRAISPAVVNGMLSGIGVLILASQFHIMVDDAPKSNGIANLLSIPQAVLNAFLQSDIHIPGSNHQVAALVGLATIALILLWTKLAPKKLQLIPPALVAVLGVTIVSAVLALPLKQVSLPDSLLASISLPTIETWSAAFDASIWAKAAALAFIASAETLLSATALDRMHQGPKTKYDRELIAQGIGNTICGALGALPMTGVIVRSSVNVQAGANTRLSAFLHGLWLLLFVVSLPFVLRLIPTASLAALLVYTGYKLINWKVYKELLAFGKTELAIWLITIAAIVGTDLLTGVLVGVALSVAKLLYVFSHLHIGVTRSCETEAVQLQLEGAATFFSLPKLASVLESLPHDTELHVNFEKLRHIDHACLDLLMNWEKQHEEQGGKLVIDWGDLHAIFRNGGRKGARFESDVVSARV